MQKVADILRSKPDQTVHTVAPTTSVSDAMKLMAARQVGALVVVEAARVVGIVTERDYARKIAAMEPTAKTTPVRDIMTAPVIRVRPEQTAHECIVLMAANHLRHLPVMDGDELVGMISIRDLANEIIDHL
jgi:CBS domain-containing protein